MTTTPIPPTTTTTTPQAAARLVTDGRQLRQLLRAVLAHAAGSDGLMVLQQVRFEIDGADLYVVATDRFTLGAAHTTVQPSTPQASFAVSIDATDLTTVLRIVRDREVGVVLTLEPTGVQIAHAGLRHTLPANEPDTFPDWRSLLGQLIHRPAPPAGVPVGIDPAKLARFHATGQSTRRAVCDPLVLRSHRPGDALVLTRGDWFVGVLMPMRLADTNQNLDQGDDADEGRFGRWRDVFPAPHSTTTSAAA